MKITTASWFTPLPPSVLRVGISRSVPRGFAPGYRRLPELHPGERSWAARGQPQSFTAFYLEQLAALDPRAIVEKLERLAAGRDVCLVCWERLEDAWCHRGLVSAWLADSLDIEVCEYGQSGAACCGHYHPKLPGHLRRDPARFYDGLGFVGPHL